jgi:predicted Zn-dependent protease
MSHVNLALYYLHSAAVIHSKGRLADAAVAEKDWEEELRRARQRVRVDRIHAQRDSNKVGKWVASGVERETAKKNDVNLEAALQVKLEALTPTIRAFVDSTLACEHDGAYNREQLTRDAIHDLNGYLKNAPKDMNAKRLRAQILASSPHVDRVLLRRAENDARESVIDKPGSASRRLSLALTEIREGTLESAVENLKAAAVLAPDDPVIHYTLGFALIQDGQVYEAENELKYAKLLDPKQWPAISNPVPECAPKVGL